MEKLFELVVFTVGFILLLVGEVVTALLGLTLKLVSFGYRAFSGRHSNRLTSLANSLLLLRKRQETAEAVAIPQEEDLSSTVEPVAVPSFQEARIHTRKYRGGSVRVILFEYQDKILRTAWIPMRNGRKGKVPRRYVMGQIESQPISNAWLATKSDLETLIEKVSTVKRDSTKKAVLAQPAAQPEASLTTPVEPSTPAVDIQSAKEAPVVKPLEAEKIAQPTATALKASKLSRPIEWIGKVLTFGTARREDVKKPYESFCVKLESELGTVENVWGADLARTMQEAEVQPGEKIHIRFVGKRPVSVVDEKGETITCEKNIYEVRRLAN